MTRFKAAAIHLGISVVVVGSFLLALTLVWYPPELWRMARIGGLIGILAGVDLALGPILTLAVFKSGKPSLKFDLTMIALLQVAGLAYGAYIMFQSRPVFFVATVERFQLVFASDIEKTDLQAGADGFTKLPLGAPQVVGATVANASEDRNAAVLNLMQGKPMALTPRNYIPYSQIARTLLASADPVNENPSTPFEQAVLDAVRAKNLRPADVVHMDLTSGRGAALMLLNAVDGSVLGPLDVDPGLRGR